MNKTLSSAEIIQSNKPTPRLEGKVALVTGASAGIGRAIAERLATDGASVVINYRSGEAGARELESRINVQGGRARAIQADLADSTQLEALFAACLREFRGLDILVNNAAMFLSKPVLEVTPSDFDQVFGVNARAAFLAMQQAARVMPANSRIINISSSATTVGFPGLALYLGSKAALEQFTLVLANELGPRKITVNTVAAGPIATRMFQDLLQTWPAEAESMLVQRTALGRIGEPADVADVVAFLASEESRWITGQYIRVDGGAR